MSVPYKTAEPATGAMIARLPKIPSGPAPPGYLPGTGASGQGFGTLERAELAQNPHKVAVGLGRQMAALNASMRVAGASTMLDNYMAGQAVSVSKVEQPAAIGLSDKGIKSE